MIYNPKSCSKTKVDSIAHYLRPVLTETPTFPAELSLCNINDLSVVQEKPTLSKTVHLTITTPLNDSLVKPKKFACDELYLEKGA